MKPAGGDNRISMAYLMGWLIYKKSEIKGLVIQWQR
jgi:hypothetical protein